MMPWNPERCNSAETGIDRTLPVGQSLLVQARILSAGMGFENIVGLPEVNEATVRAAGGSWYGSVTCTNGEEPDVAAYTSASASDGVATLFKGFSEYDDGLPIVFSWPVASETVDMSDFQFTLNTGEVVFPNSAGMWPNWELNERNVVVVFGDFGNRGLSREDDAIFPVRLDIVADATPLLLIGPGGQEFNAVGLSWETNTSPYDSGPVLVGAKLNAVGAESLGEGGLSVAPFLGIVPNDEFALYDEGDFRIRVLTTGGFSPDGVTGIRPDMYENFFRVHVNGENGETVLLEEVGVEYAVAGGSLRVVGLSELGQKENPDGGISYDDCYAEDRDNYIDIILVGDEAAARNVAFVEIPALEGGYRPFYNPGGPGLEPFEGVRYTAPGPPDLEPVMIALDDPMRVDRNAP
ncbi:MAG: phospholipase [Blastochloris sp.]|nr:phospholipase [Blastochloris sp.]